MPLTRRRNRKVSIILVLLAFDSITDRNFQFRFHVRACNSVTPRRLEHSSTRKPIHRLVDAKVAAGKKKEKREERKKERKELDFLD